MDVKENPSTEKKPWLWNDGNWNSRLVPLITLLVCMSALLFIPLKIVSLGYLPVDDALRHAGMAMTERSWDAILVSEAPIPDVHIGWHASLKTIRTMFGFGADELVVSSVILFFLILLIPALLLHRRPESWIFALVFYLSIGIPGTRWMLGRPFLAHMAVVSMMLLLREKLCQKRTSWFAILLLFPIMAISIWWRTTWFLYAVPIAAFFIARQWRACIRLSAIVITATGLVTLLTGDLTLPLKPLLLSIDVMRSSPHISLLATELQPLTNYMLAIFSVIAIALFEKNRDSDLRKKFDSPVFYLLLISWVLGCLSKRWWLDFGTVAFLIFVSETIDAFLTKGTSKEVLPPFSLKRGIVAALACVILFLNFTSDAKGRWSKSLSKEYIVLEDETIADFLPEPGGIVYSDDMLLFYSTFFKHPDADWKYLLGFEPAFMPKSDLETLRKIQWNSYAVEMYKPWVDKMRPEDRLWLRQSIGAFAPGIPGLEWKKITTHIWSGKPVNPIE